MTFTKVTEYRCSHIVIRFEPVIAPPYSHSVRIIVDGKMLAKDWLSWDFKVSAKVADYFYQKYKGIALLEQAARAEEP